jgi:large subunit ribosomal protein L9
MKVILKTDITNLGKKGDIKEVSTGYARNYLIPNGLALEATESNLLILKREKEIYEKKKKTELERIKGIIQKLYKSSINITAKTGESEKLFGTITKEDIANAIMRDTGIAIDKHDIELDEPIKTTGIYSVDVKIRLKDFPEEEPKIAKVKIWVIGEK